MSEIALDEDGIAAEPPAQKPRFNKKMKIIAAAMVALLLIGGAAAFLLMPGGKDTQEEASTEESPAGEGAETYIEVPAMVVNLRSTDGVGRFLKIRFVLVPVSAAKGEEITAKLPLLIDAYQPFLRELRPEDLAGSAAVFRIKEEMLVRATATLGTDSVKDVLIQDLIQQ